jgi:transcription elongation factor SPT5
VQVVLRPALDDFTELIRFPSTQLAKHFERGKHVKVTAGRHEGDTGMVVAVEEGVATIFTDITQVRFSLQLTMVSRLAPLKSLL